MTVTLHHGDCIDIMRTLPSSSVDAIVTDPPYGLGFMGKAWDELPPGLPWATECLRVLKPGGHLLAFGGTRTFHRLAVAVEDAGFEIRDSIAWLSGSGFPKSLNASKALDDRRCRCQMGESDRGANGVEQGTGAHLSDLRDGVLSLAEQATGPATAGLLPPMPRQEGRGPSGPDGAAGAPGLDDRAAATDGSGEPCLEGRRDTQAPEGQLLGGQVRPLPTGVPGDGASGRLHHGAPARDGSVGGSLPAEVGGGQPQGPRPVEQLAGEPGALPIERGSQAWGGWPVCERCSQPVVPDGLGTALKPGHEPIVVARKPLIGTVAANVLTHGTGALNIDATRIGDGERFLMPAKAAPETFNQSPADNGYEGKTVSGRWPANVVLDESQADALDLMSGTSVSRPAEGIVRHGRSGGIMGAEGALRDGRPEGHADAGGASRFFYTAKADSSERVKVDGIAHPTVKPLTLMRWLVRLVTPPGGTVLEPFAGSGTTVEACILEGFQCIAIEREADYLPLIQQRINRRRDPVAAIKTQGEDGGLFDLLDGGAA